MKRVLAALFFETLNFRIIYCLELIYIYLIIAHYNFYSFIKLQYFFKLFSFYYQFYFLELYC
jgi:hypothetical protein